MGLLPIVIKKTLGSLFERNYLTAEDIIEKRKEIDDSIVLSLSQEEIYLSRYPEAAELFKAALQKRKLSRDKIIYIKYLINQLLGSKKKYYDYHYKNDAHEIYTKLKSPFLDNWDYKRIIDTINMFTNTNN